MTHVLITGSEGFLGPHVVRECERWGWDVTRWDRKIAPMKDVRYLTPRVLAEVDYVFHLAWRTNIPDCILHPVKSTSDNILMTAHLLDVAANAGVRKVIFHSTASLYGWSPTPWLEEMPPNPVEPYSWQKLSCEYACKMWSLRYGLPTVVLRLFQVFGEGQREDTSLAKFFQARREGRPIKLTETTAQSTFRSGQRDFVYAGDVARGMALAAQSELHRGEIINLGTSRVRTMEEIAEAIGGEVEWIPKRGYEVERHEADITLASTKLGWKPEVDVLDWIGAQVKETVT